MNSSFQQPQLTQYYHRFLSDGSSANFVRDVAGTYTVPTLHRLSQHPCRHTRRAAILVVTMLGRSESVATVADALHDNDRGVRLLAEDGLPALWRRQMSVAVRQALRAAARWEAAGKIEQALESLNPNEVNGGAFGEFWFARARVISNLDPHEAVDDCRRALEIEPTHFSAAALMADGFFTIGDLPKAVETIKATLAIHPHWDYARQRMRRWQRDLRERSDC